MILITGATGFIGRRVMEKFTDESIGIGLNANTVKSVVECNLVSDDSVNALIKTLQGKDIRAIVHTAGVTPWSPSPNWDDDIEMAKRIIHIAKRLHIPKIVYLSGWVVYDGDPHGAPYREGTIGSASALSEYGRSKLAVERLLSEACSEGTIISLRLASIYGPGQTSAGLIPNLVQEALQKGTVTLQAKQTKRDYVYIDDAINAIVQAVELTAAGSQCVNVGSGISVSVTEVAKSIAQVLMADYGKKLRVLYANPLNESPCADNVMSTEKALRLGILKKSRTDFLTGVRNYIHWKVNA